MLNRILGWFRPETPPVKINGIEVIDKRAKAQPFTVHFFGDNDPYHAIIASAALLSGLPVMGNVDDKGRLTLTDA